MTILSEVKKTTNVKELLLVKLEGKLDLVKMNNPQNPI